MILVIWKKDIRLSIILKILTEATTPIEPILNPPMTVFINYGFNILKKFKTEVSDYDFGDVTKRHYIEHYFENLNGGNCLL